MKWLYDSDGGFDSTEQQERRAKSRSIPLTQQALRDIVAYDPATGVFTWLKPQAKKCAVGAVAGHPDIRGYIRVGLNYQMYLAHRLVWLYVHGQWPAGALDHVDGLRSNNALANLREATSSENNHNRAKTRRPTSSRFLGVYWHKKTGRWIARIGLNGKQRYLGLFASEEEAYAAYLRAKAVLHPAQPIPRDTAYDHRDPAQ